MSPQTERHGASEPAPATRPPPRMGAPGAYWLRAFAAVVVVLLLALSTALLLVQREAALERARTQALRAAQRQAVGLEQSLRLAQASLHMAPPPTGQGADTQPDPALPLPFALRRLDPAATGHSPLPEAQWVPGQAPPADGPGVLSLRWRQPAAEGGQVYEMNLPHAALLARFAAEGLPPGASLGLLRLEDDGTATVLLHHPGVPGEQGRTLRGQLADALRQAPAGVFEDTAPVDGEPSLVGFQRLAAGADRLVLTDTLPVRSALAGWTAGLPVAIALMLLVATAIAYGAWRLDRSLRAQARSERHFQTLSDHLPDVVVRYDPSGRVLYANPAVQAVTGIPAQNMLGRTLEQYGAQPELVAQWRACLQQVFATGQPQTLRFSHSGPKGDRHWEAQATLEPVTAGDPPTALVITRDITERHEAQARQRSAQQLFETVFQAAPEAMSLSDWGTGRLLLVNDAFCMLFGRPREQLIGHSALDLDLWAPEVRRQLIERLERGEQVRDATERSLRPDGLAIHVRYSAERVQQEGEQRLLLMFRDVSQLESEQRALVRSETRFRLAAAHGQVWEWDFGHGFVQPSDEFFVALGYPSPAPDQMGPLFLDLLHPEDRPRLRQALLSFFQGEADYRLEFRARDAQGDYRWFDTRGSGLRDASGRVTYMAGTTFEITDRKVLEEAQRQTLKHLDTVTNASAALAWTVDARQHPDWLNQAWLDFTGRDLISECEAPWLDDVHPQDRERCEKVFNESFAARRAYSMEYRLLRHDGEYRWLHEQGRPRHDADHRFIGYVGSCLDVTELRRAEAAVLERGALLEQVFDVIKDMLFMVDEQERFVFFKAASEDRLLRHPDDFLGQTIGDVLPPHLVAELRPLMGRAQHSGPQELDYSLDLPAGTHHFNARLAWLPGNRQCMFMVRDTTEQQKTHAERERLNGFVLLLFRLASRFINLPLHRMDEAIDTALGDMGVFVGADRVYLFAYDPLAGTATNTHEWCAAGIEPHMSLWQDVPIGNLQDWRQMHQRGEKIVVTDVQTLPGSALRDVLESIGIRGLLTLPLMDGEDCLGFVGLDSVHHARVYGSEEITLLELFAQMLVNLRLRAQAAAQVREMTEQLEHKVEERTQQLHESVQRLQTVNRELESFTYSASHDLRTPLRGIEGFSTLLLDEHADQLDEQGREYLQRIQRATLHMSQLVSDLLAYSRLQQLTEHSEPVALSACVQAVAAPFRDELEARQGQLSALMPDDLCVQASPQGLAIVLRNLIDNALKFTPAHDAPRVRIEARAVGERVRLSVSDQGIGFDMRYHDRIFGMFQRLHRQDQIPGTGIGLALVQKAVERMGGQIRAQSAPGQGARFEMDLPRA